MRYEALKKFVKSELDIDITFSNILELMILEKGEVLENFTHSNFFIVREPFSSPQQDGPAQLVKKRIRPLNLDLGTNII